MAEAQTCTVRFSHNQRNVSARCRWWFEAQDGPHRMRHLYLVPESVTVEDDANRAESVEIRLSDAASSHVIHSKYNSAARIVEFLTSWLTQNGAISELTSPAAVFLVSNDSGFLVHSEFVPHRMISCELVSSAKSFVLPRAEVSNFAGEVRNIAELANALGAAVGAVQLSRPTLQDRAADLRTELERRLTLTWLVPEQPKAYRIGIVINPEKMDFTRQRWESAAALGLTCVVFSSETAWMGDDTPFAHLREAIVKIDLTQNETLWERIVDVVQKYPIPLDGLYTGYDYYILAMAKAATHLGMHAMDPEAITISTNKYLTGRRCFPDAQHSFAVNKIQELDDRMEAIQFPVVCKPSIGAGSEGVFKARDAAELRPAVISILEHNKNKYGALIEPYASGPELDVNLIMFEGKMLYSEVADDFPSDADVEDSPNALFTESQDVRPSKLPDAEQELCTRDMIEVVRKIGLTTGVFHCEARVQGSAMSYKLSPGAKIPDLELTNVKEANPPSMFLHEVNARMPGYMTSFATLVATGVDFWACSLLCALRDEPRATALAQAFALNVSGSERGVRGVVLNQSGYAHVSLKLVQSMFPDIPVSGLDGIVVRGKDDPTPELRRRAPDVAKYVLQQNAALYAAHRYGFGDSTGYVWAATTTIRSPHGRQHALDIAAAYTELYTAIIEERDRALGSKMAPFKHYSS